MDFKIKYKRPTEKKFGHTAIFLDGQEIGYFMPTKTKIEKGHNWCLRVVIGNVTHISYCTNRDKTLDDLNEIMEENGINIKSHLQKYYSKRSGKQKV